MDQSTPKKIVVVEDNTSLSEIYKTRLELIGYQVFAAYDGNQALAVIEHELPDLVLLDLMVPKVAGDQILEIMRGSDWGKNIKVYVISNLNEADAPAGLRNYGISGYVVKANLSNDDLDKLVDSILKPAEQTEAVDSLGISPTQPVVNTTVGAEPASAVEPSQPEMMDASPVIAAPQPVVNLDTVVSPELPPVEVEPVVPETASSTSPETS
ncbi:MAG TPA: response regulator [Candidatus Saccharimonadales bacterium]|nr:response regulator [Candidatus Saccharimonadales bacterium]